MTWYSIVISFVIAAFVIYAIGATFIENFYRWRFILQVWKAFSIKKILECIGALIVVIVAALLFNQVNFLSYGYMHLFSEQGGSIVSIPASGHESGNIWLHIGSIAFLVLFLIAVPFLAELEEKMFREGRLTWKRMIKRSIVFGLSHCLMGISIGTGLALCFGGLFFAVKYRNSYKSHFKWEYYTLEQPEWKSRRKAEAAALFESTVYHSLYNSILIIMLLVISIIML